MLLLPSDILTLFCICNFQFIKMFPPIAYPQRDEDKGVQWCQNERSRGVGGVVSKFCVYAFKLIPGRIGRMEGVLFLLKD